MLLHGQASCAIAHCFGCSCNRSELVDNRDGYRDLEEAIKDSEGLMRRSSQSWSCEKIEKVRWKQVLATPRRHRFQICFDLARQQEMLTTLPVQQTRNQPPTLGLIVVGPRSCAAPLHFRTCQMAPWVRPAGGLDSRLASSTERMIGQLFSAPRTKPGTSASQRS